jgi:hypothetical protein
VSSDHARDAPRPGIRAFASQQTLVERGYWLQIQCAKSIASSRYCGLTAYAKSSKCQADKARNLGDDVLDRKPGHHLGPAEMRLLASYFVDTGGRTSGTPMMRREGDPTMEHSLSES